MKLLIILDFFLLIMLTGCNSWIIRSVSVTSPASPPPTRTPSVLTATPIFPSPILTVPAVGSTLTPTQLTNTVTPVNTLTTTETPAGATLVPTLITFPPELLKVDILGCNTSLDVTHGMGEVTNAFLTLSNPGTTDLENICATLRGQDEGRIHPDKTKCISSLSAGFQVTLKLTIDTTYQEGSPIQIDINSGDVLLQRIGKGACTKIGLFPPDNDDLGLPKPIP